MQTVRLAIFSIIGRSVMLHSLKANLVNLQDENKPTLHADCYISTSPVEGVSYIPDAWAVACLVRRFYQNLLS